MLLLSIWSDAKILVIVALFGCLGWCPEWMKFDHFHQYMFPLVNVSHPVEVIWAQLTISFANMAMILGCSSSIKWKVQHCDEKEQVRPGGCKAWNNHRIKRSLKVTIRIYPLLGDQLWCLSTAINKRKLSSHLTTDVRIWSSSCVPYLPLRALLAHLALLVTSPLYTCGSMPTYKSDHTKTPSYLYNSALAH